jgi:hypothetical protein
MMGSMFSEVGSSLALGLLCGRVGWKLQVWAALSVGCREYRDCISAYGCKVFVRWCVCCMVARDLVIMATSGSILYCMRHTIHSRPAICSYSNLTACQLISAR